MKAILHADGGTRGNPGPSASGAVLHTDTGDLIHEIGAFIGHATNNVAEYTGLIEGLEKALAVGVTDVSIRLDSELVIRQITGEYRVKHEAMIPLHAKAKALLARFASYEIRHIAGHPVKGRPDVEHNEHADRICNAVLDANEAAFPVPGKKPRKR